MKIKLKDNWELDCIILKKNGEKITYKYDSIEDKLIKIVEVKEEELKELLTNSSPDELIKPKSSNKPSSMSKDTLKSSKDNIKKSVIIKGHKVSLDKIKHIKLLAETTNLTNKEIANKVGVSPQLINYWRHNTPKDINEK
jgi:DNA-binding transcriptional regulator YiaG